MPISLDEVRRRILIAMVSDDDLLNALVLKGGNALTLVHDIGMRSSLDMDFSIATNFPDLDEARRKIFQQLRREFSEVGYVVFDEKFVPKPSQPGEHQPEWWGGYFIEFKLAEQEIYDAKRDNLEDLRRHAAVLGPDQKRKYTIDISKNEYCAAKVRKELDGYTIYVYSPEMIAIEKLRAICQQMPQYTITSKNRKTPRARDFYDIHEIVRQKDVDLRTPENRELFIHIFEAKRVPLELLREIGESRSFHSLDWPAVEISLSGKHEGFDYYFDSVLALVSDLQAFWVEDPPS